MHIVKAYVQITSSYNTEALFINLSCCVTGPRLRYLPRHRRHEPRVSHNIEYIQVIEHLYTVAPSKHIQCILTLKVYHRVASSRQRNAHRLLFVVCDFEPLHVLEAEVIHIIHELLRIASKYP